MAIKLFNTLTRKKEKFQPIINNTVRMYNCGPTVYSFAHIGNFRSFLFADLLRRLFELENYKIEQVINVTDVGHLTNDTDESGEDKIQKQADKEKLNPWKLTEKYTQAFMKDCEILKIEKAEHYPKATKHINEMIEIIKQLIKKGYAYVANNNNVYFDISKFEEYGKLSGVKIEELEQGDRAVQDPHKRSQFDFALWFSNSKHKNHIMKWDSPWGEGYPGWHIECSAMSMKYLTDVFKDNKVNFDKFQTIDIHTGGEDNLFPHHDSEIAQTEGATNKKFSNFWLHVKHLSVNGQKMSKSLGNFYTIKELLEKGFSANAIRLALMSTHYRQKLNLTFESINAAQANIDRVQEVVDKLLEIDNLENPEFLELSNKYRDKFRDALSDDLNVSEALGITFKFINEINKILTKTELSAIDAGYFLNYFMDFNKIFAVLRFEKQVIPNKIVELAEERKNAKDHKDYVTADKLRNQIKEQGYQVKDNKDGSYKLKKI
jgi:cysteinyl-tRNA synthetase